MVIATAMMITSLITQCGSGVDPTTTAAIIKVESGGNPYAIGDNTTRKSYRFNSKEEAIAAANYLLNNGHSVDMGLMQINSIHLKSMNLSLDEVFTPCSNIKIGTSILKGFYKKHNNEPDKNIVLFKALSAYNTGSAWRGEGYINRVLKAANSGYRVKLNFAPPKPPTKTTNNAAVQSVKIEPENSGLFCSGRGFKTETNPTAR